jgi:predicted nucleic acid-binding protein
MPFVIDNSITMDWCFIDESTPFGDRVLAMLEEEPAHVPAIWPLEVANAIRMGERRGRLDRTSVDQFLAILGRLPIRVEALALRRATGSVLGIARDFNLTTYDAAYLELAHMTGLPLATKDDQLADAARRIGVRLID